MGTGPGIILTVLQNKNWGSAEKTFIWNDAMLEQCREECKVTDVNYTQEKQQKERLSKRMFKQSNNLLLLFFF